MCSIIQSADSEPQGSSSTGLTSDVAVAQSPQVRHVQQPALPLHSTPAILGAERWPSLSSGNRRERSQSSPPWPHLRSSRGTCSHPQEEGTTSQRRPTRRARMARMAVMEDIAQKRKSRRTLQTRRATALCECSCEAGRIAPCLSRSELPDSKERPGELRAASRASEIRLTLLCDCACRSVHDFDPDATPEQKKAQAMRGARERLGPISDRFADRRHGGTGAWCAYPHGMDSAGADCITA